jgi:hypothetical protein
MKTDDFVHGRLVRSNMQLKATIVFYYDLPDDPEERMQAYGVSDPEACANVDAENDPEDLIGLAKPSRTTMTVEVVK